MTQRGTKKDTACAVCGRLHCALLGTTNAAELADWRARHQGVITGALPPVSYRIAPEVGER